MDRDNNTFKTLGNINVTIGLGIALIVLGSLFNESCEKVADMALATGCFVVAGFFLIIWLTLCGYTFGGDNGAVTSMGLALFFYFLVTMILSAITVDFAFFDAPENCDKPRTDAIGGVSATLLTISSIVMFFVCCCGPCILSATK
jgi:uncharacterized membrane protein YozB (DUF420 family)